MTRVMRRAGIPLWYTEGFNRHPYLTFAAPLSLGYEGLHETMDLRLEEEMPMEELVRRINEAMPEGLCAVSAAEAVCKAGDLHSADYRLTFDAPLSEVTALLARPEILVEKRNKKKELITLDIAPAFSEAKVRAEGDGTVMAVRLPCNSTQTVNPGLFLTALNAVSPCVRHCDVLRVELRTADGRAFR